MSNQSQKVIWDAIHQADPSLVVHGHWHYRTKYQIPEHRAIILGLDQASGGSPHDAWAVLDTEKAALYDLNNYLHEGEPLWRLGS